MRTCREPSAPVAASRGTIPSLGVGVETTGSSLYGRPAAGGCAIQSTAPSLSTTFTGLPLRSEVAISPRSWVGTFVVMDPVRSTAMSIKDHEAALPDVRNAATYEV